MYTTNLPDCVVIPDMLLELVENDQMDDEAKDTVRAWVDQTKDASQSLQCFWVKQVDLNITLCKKYGIPECVRFFTYVRSEMDAAW